MSRNYKFHNPDGAYFISIAAVEWLDVFTRSEYKTILIDSLRFCHKNKRMEIFAWCIMTNHLHLVFRAEDYLYSSAADYAGEQGVLENVIVVSSTTRCNRAGAGGLFG